MFLTLLVRHNLCIPCGTVVKSTRASSDSRKFNKIVLSLETNFIRKQEITMDNDCVPLCSSVDQIAKVDQPSQLSTAVVLQPMQLRFISGSYIMELIRTLISLLLIARFKLNHDPQRPNNIVKAVPSIMYPVANTSASAPAANTGPLLLGPENTFVECPFCQKQIKTAVKYSNHTGTHIAAAIWGRMCCLCCIPYCSDSAKNADHYCPGCQRYLGTYRT